MLPGELLRTETLGGRTYEVRRGGHTFPLVVFRDGVEYARFSRVELGWPIRPPLMHVIDVADTLCGSGSPVGHSLELRRVGGEIWDKEHR